MSANSSGNMSLTGNDLLLFSNQILDQVKFNETGNNSYEQSNIKRWLNSQSFTGNYLSEGFLNNAFSVNEQKGILEFYGGASAKSNFLTNPYIGTSSESGNKIFLLGANEVQNKDYGFFGDFSDEAVSRRITATPYAIAQGTKKYLTGIEASNENSYWYLHSVNGGNNNVGIVDNTGELFSNDSSRNDTIGVCPAFNVNSQYVVLSSGINTKNSFKIGEIGKVNTYSGNEYILTINNSNLSVNISKAEYYIVGEAKKIKITYTNATVGKNQYISGIVVDSENNIKGYGRIIATDSSLKENGEITMDYPSFYDPKKDSLYIFSEQCNSLQGKYTDYANLSNVPVVLTALDDANIGATETTSTETTSTEIISTENSSMETTITEYQNNNTEAANNTLEIANESNESGKTVAVMDTSPYTGDNNKILLKVFKFIGSAFMLLFISSKGNKLL